MSCWTANRRGVASHRTRDPRPPSPGARRRRRAARDPAGQEMLAPRTRNRHRCVGESEPALPRARRTPRVAKATHGDRGDGRIRDGDRSSRGPERENRRRSRHARLAARLLRHAHPDDVARLPVGVHVLRRRDHLGPRLSRALGRATCSTRWRASSKRLPVKMIQIKDDTFTTNKKRVLELCKRMRERKLGFFWSCDTRVDLLSDEPSCARCASPAASASSLGVESGSPAHPRRSSTRRSPSTRSSSRPSSRRSTASRSATT